MNMYVPKPDTLHTYAASLYDSFVPNDEITFENILALCKYVALVDDIDIDTMREILSGEYRPIGLRCKVVSCYPHPSYLPSLASMFEVYRQSLFTGKFNDVDYVFWTLGALFRSIKFFTNGNAIIGHLIENAMRQRFNLAWRLIPAPQAEFKRYHREVFCKNYPRMVV